MIEQNESPPIGGLLTTSVSASFNNMTDNHRKIAKAYKRALLNLFVGIILTAPVAGIAKQPMWPNTASTTALPGNGKTKAHLSFQCPKAFLGIKGDMLPTHWQADDRGHRLQIGYASIDGAYMICNYRSLKNRKQRFGPVRRLVPRGYRCISDGISSFRCQKK